VASIDEDEDYSAENESIDNSSSDSNESIDGGRRRRAVAKIAAIVT